MSGYGVTLTPEAVKDIKRLDNKEIIRILNKIEWLGKNANLIRHQLLKEAKWTK